MSTITILIRYQDISFVSDRTARETIKRLSKIVRRAQAAEILYLLDRLPLSLDEKQSVRDKAITYMADAPMLQIESAQRGSWKIVATLGAFGLWFLSNTLGESIKDGWTETKAHKTIVKEIKNYVDEIRPDKFLCFLKRALESEEFEGRWELKKLERKHKKTCTEYVITVCSIAGDHPSHQEFIDGNYIMKHLSPRK